MITPANIHTARRLLSQWDVVNAARIAKDRKPLRNWMREAKQLVGFASTHRPTSGIVAYMLQKYTDKVEAAMANVARGPNPTHVPDIGGDPMPTTQADTLPAPPEVITIHIRPGRSEEIADATTVADYNAARSPIAIVARTLAQYEAEVREKVKRHAAFVGVDDEARRMLNIAAHLHEAAKLLGTHATPDQHNG